MTTELERSGHKIIEGVYSEREVDDILALLNSKGVEKKFGVRELLIKYPEISGKIFTEKLKNIIKQICPKYSQPIKSIYFDKPPNANWIVNWHQDLTINLKAKKDVPGYKNWRVNEERAVVQPDRKMLESIFTIRIHLDDCTRENGALRVIKSSHAEGIIEIKNWLKNKKGEEHICEVRKGGLLLMRPLILHSSRRTENKMNRRVLHIELCEHELPAGLEWKEQVLFKK